LVDRFQFVADHKHAFGVKRLCNTIGLATSSYYYWQGTAANRVAREEQDLRLAALIVDIQDPKKGGDRAYGRPRVTAEVNDRLASTGERINEKRVGRVMAKFDLVGLKLKSKVVTTVSEESDEKYPDLLERDFTADEINKKYVGDITYIPVKDYGNLYLASVIDCASRKVAGWALADHMRTELVEDALKAALVERGSLKGAIFHSDRGSVYTSKDYAELCKILEVSQSMGNVGSSADNALAESFWATLKRELLGDREYFDSTEEAQREIFRWMHSYNNKRRHSWCDYMSPNQYEATKQESYAKVA
jgi:transposase InsO family protein